MSPSFKKILLTGTALVAVSFLPAPAQAVSLNMDDASAIWAETGDLAAAVTDDSVIFTTLTTSTMKIVNDGVADDNLGFNTFKLGNVTDTGTGVGSIAVTIDAGGGGNEIVTINNAIIDGDFSLTHANGIAFNQTVTVTKNLDIGGTLTIDNQETANAQSSTLTVGDTLTVDGITSISTGTKAGATAALVVKGNATFSDTVTVTGGTGAGADSTLTLSGTTSAFTKGLVLDDGTAGLATLVLEKTSAQTVSGTIKGIAAGDGTLLIKNDVGATFTGTVGAVNKLKLITISNDFSADAATFMAAVSATDIILGNGGNADTNTLTFNGSSGGFTVTGKVNGAGGSDVNNVVITGANTITTSGVWGGVNPLDNVTLSGANLTTGLSSALTAKTITVGAATTLTAGSLVTTTSGISITGAAGTVTVASGVNLTSDVSATGNYGVLNLNGGTQLVSGATGDGVNSLAEVNAGKSLGTSTFSGAMYATALTIGTGQVNLNGFKGAANLGGLGGTLVLVTGGADGAIDNLTGSGGTLTLSAAGAQTVTGLVGATGALTEVNAGAAGATSTFSKAMKATTLKVISTGTVVLNGLTGAVDFVGGGGVVKLASGTSVSGTVDNSSGTGGTLTLMGGLQTIANPVGATGKLTEVDAGAAGAVSTFTGAVTATTLIVTGTGTVNLNGGLTGAADFSTNNGLIKLASGKSITGNVSATGTNGTLTLSGGAQTIGGATGNGGTLVEVNAGATGAVSTFTGAVTTTNLNVTGTGTVNLKAGLAGDASFIGGGGTITLSAGDISGTGIVSTTTNTKGTLTLSGTGNQSVSGQVGDGTFALAAVNGGSTLAKTSTFSQALYATKLNVTGKGKVELNDFTGAASFGANDGFITLTTGDITGSVDATTLNTGTLTLNGVGQTVTGKVGFTQALNAVSAGNFGLSTFNDTVNAKTLNIGGFAVDLLKGVTGNVDFLGLGGTLLLESGTTVTGTVDNSVGLGGTLSLLGGAQTIVKLVGATGDLGTINAGLLAGDVSTFSKAVKSAMLNAGAGIVYLNGGFAGDTDFGVSDGLIVLASGMSITAGIGSGNVGATGGVGTLTLAGGTQGVAGDTGNLKIVNAAAASSTTTFTGAVTALDLNLSTGTAIINGAGGFTGGANFGASDGVLTLSLGDINGTVNATGGVATLNMTSAGAQLVTGTVSALKAVFAGQSGGTTTFSDDMTATTLTIGTGGVILNGVTGLTGNADFANKNGTLTLTTGIVSGFIDNSAGVGGNLILNGPSQTIANLVGFNGALATITAGQAGGASTFLSFVNSDLLTLGTGSVDLNGLKGKVNFAGFGGVLNLASGTTVSGDIDSTGSSSGIANFLGGAQPVAGKVGFTNALSTINGGVAGSSISFAKTVSAANINVLSTGTLDFADNAAGNLNFAGDGAATLAAGKTLTGNIDNTFGIPPTGNMNFASSGGVIGAIGATNPLNTLNLNGIGGVVGTLGVGQLVTVGGGSVNAAATNNLSGNTLAVTAGTFTTVAGQTLNTTLTTAITPSLVTGGNITSSGIATIASGTFVSIDVKALTYVNDLAAFKFVDGTGGTFVAPGLSITDNSFFFGFTQGGSTSDLDLIVNRPLLASLSNTVNGDQVANVLDDLGGASTGALMTIQLLLQNAMNSAQFNNILEGVVPTVDNSATVTSLNVGGVVGSVVEARLASLRTGGGMTGMSAGYDTGESYISGENMWIQGYGQLARQSTDGGIKGFSATTVGTAFGIDSTNVLNGAVFGVSFNYAKTTADSDNANTTSTDVGSYGLNLYSSYDVGEELFLNGQLGYAYNKIVSDRHNVVNPGDAANADYGSSQFSAKLALGSDFAVDYSMMMSPSLLFDYTHLATAAYTETGIGNAGLDVSSAGFNVLKLGFGVNTSWNLRNYDGSMLKPAVRLGYAYNLVNDRVETTSSFIGDPSGATFKTTGAAPSRSAFNIGGGVTYMTNANWDLSANYDYTYKVNYDAHAGTVRATARF